MADVQFWRGGITITERDEDGKVKRQSSETAGETVSRTHRGDGTSRVTTFDKEKGEIVEDKDVPTGR